MGVLFSFLFLLSLTLVTSTEYVPVLIWGSRKSTDSYPIFSAFTKLSSIQFIDYIRDRIVVEKPLILVFLEENLSMEDFSWSDIYGNGAFPLLKNITDTAAEVIFLPSVDSPYNSLRKLKNYGYSWNSYDNNNFNLIKKNENAIFEIKLEEPNYLNDRPDMLKNHDKKIAKIYNEVLNYSPNVMAFYFGNHMSWLDAELTRYKREEKNPAVDFIFSIEEDNWWTLDGAEIQDLNERNLNPVEPIGAPAHYSYFCNPTVVLSNNEVSLTFENFQVQPKLEGDLIMFGPVLHCIPYFSIAIWSGLAVVFILSVVLAWGIVMIMDINTNDKFDDPKGKL